MIQYTDVIVDLQAGDTGKGKVAHALAKNYDMVLRYNGGANATAGNMVIKTIIFFIFLPFFLWQQYLLPLVCGLPALHQPFYKR